MTQSSRLVNLLIFPHQLFDDHPGLEQEPKQVVLVEDSLFFGDHRYPLRFHKQKIWLHRATMKRFEARLQSEGWKTIYRDYSSDPGSLLQHIKSLPAHELVLADPVDFILRKRLDRIAEKLGRKITYLDTPGFINTHKENQSYRGGRKRWFMADFYKWQRQRLDILMNGSEPEGGKWSFDEDNRKKVPKKLLTSIPALPVNEYDDHDEEARQYVADNFKDNPGDLDELFYPTSHEAASDWLEIFLRERFENFGAFEDAIVEGESWLWHSVLTPSLNTGLLTPSQVMDATVRYAGMKKIPINSVEGFVRQIIGWREFMRATYEDLGVTMRTTNFWKHTRPMPASFYDGTTGIVPVDDTIRRILKTGYCHHIERLMVLGGFMFLCEIDPRDIYTWFMELFIDSYDWVMVPNVYAMSQNADGGLITTKPYFSGSSYVRKMSHYKKGPWCDIWDGLYWRWIWNHAEELSKNPRWAMMCSMVRKMDEDKRQAHLQNAEKFLAPLEKRR